VHTTITRRVLVLCPDAANSQVIEYAIRPWMFETVVCSSLRESKDLLTRQDFGVAFCEDRFEDGTYPDLLSIVRSSYRVPVVVMISDLHQDGTFREAMKLGAFGVIASPCLTKDVQWMVIQATQSESASKPKLNSRSGTAPAPYGLERHK
jgi:DNA-binding NtrC family response regulator